MMKIVNPNVNKVIEQEGTLKLNLGSGLSKVDNFFNLDVVELPGVDIVANLNEPFNLLPDNSVDAIYSRASFEHVKNLMGLMNEVHRICKPNAEICIIVPHFSNPYYYSDPTHAQPFGLYTMHYFMDESVQPGRKVPSFYTKTRFNLKSIKIQFYREKLIDKLLEPIVSRLTNISIDTQDVYERRFCYLYPAWQITYLLSNKK